MSALAFSIRALSPDGSTLIATIVASRPMMTITTISSTRVKPSSRTSGGVFADVSFGTMRYA